MNLSIASTAVESSVSMNLKFQRVRADFWEVSSEAMIDFASNDLSFENLFNNSFQSTEQIV